MSLLVVHINDTWFVMRLSSTTISAWHGQQKGKTPDMESTNKSENAFHNKVLEVLAPRHRSVLWHLVALIDLDFYCTYLPRHGLSIGPPIWWRCFPSFILSCVPHVITTYPAWWLSTWRHDSQLTVRWWIWWRPVLWTRRTILPWIEWHSRWTVSERDLRVRRLQRLTGVSAIPSWTWLPWHSKVCHAEGRPCWTMSTIFNSFIYTLSRLRGRFSSMKEC